MTRRAFLGLGSNLGERLTYLRAAVEAMPDVVQVSSLYETDPIGGPEQGAYLNCVVELDTDLSPRELLDLCRALEAEAERIRVERWGPRTLDVDVVYVDGEVVNEPDLIVPHPRWRERAFVMIPLGELAPDLLDGWVDPDEGEVRNLGALDTGLIDMGSPDTGLIDMGSPDTGAIDMGAIDTGSVDMGSIDTVSVDTGSIDVGVGNTGSPDTGSIDTVSIDTELL